MNGMWLLKTRPTGQRGARGRGPGGRRIASDLVFDGVKSRLRNFARGALSAAFGQTPAVTS